MLYRTLGRTGLRISAISFGAGPVSGWMAELLAQQQRAVIKRALEVGINWFDTAAGYGDGQSERSLGGVLGILGLPSEVHLGPACDLKSEAIRFVLGHPHVSSTLIGFREPQQIDEAVAFLSDRPYPAACLRTVLSAAGEPMPSPEGHT